MAELSNLRLPLSLYFCMALCIMIAHSVHLNDWMSDAGAVAESYVPNLTNLSVRPPHPKWKETNFAERISTFPKLPSSFKTEQGTLSPPPQYIQNIAPKGFSWKKITEFTSEFNQVKKGVKVSKEELSRWTSNNAWKGNFPGVFDPKNIDHDGKARVLRVRRHKTPTPAGIFASAHGPKNKDPTKSRLSMKKSFFSTSFMKSSKTITYGYFEIACKLGDSTLSSSFWLKEHGGRNREIDVFEYSTSTNIKIFGKYDVKKTFGTNIHADNFKYSKTRPVETPKDLSKEKFIKVGLQWGTTHVRWYLNDRLMRDVDHGGVFNGPMNVQIDREFLPFFGEPPKKDKLGDFKIFYVRTWQLRKN